MAEAIILPKTPASLFWTDTGWEYIDDAGTQKPLPAGHVLTMEYPRVAMPNPPIPLLITNASSASITLTVSTIEGSSISPSSAVKIDQAEVRTWQCWTDGGTSCGTPPSVCNSWKISGTSAAAQAVQLPDPTFKVRWQVNDGPLA